MSDDSGQSGRGGAGDSDDAVRTAHPSAGPAHGRGPDVRVGAGSHAGALAHADAGSSAGDPTITTVVDSLLDITDLGVVVLDPALRLRLFSAGVVRYGRLQSRDHGRSLSELPLTFEPGDRARLVEDAREAAERGVESGRELRCPDGGWVLSRVRPFRQAGGGRDVLITLQDLTANKLLELDLRTHRDRLERFLGDGLDGFMDWHIETDEVFINERYARLIGLPDARIVPMTALESRIHPDDLDTFRTARGQQLRDAPGQRFSCELRHGRPGDWSWWLMRGQVVDRAADGTPTRLLAILMDIGALKSRETRVRRQAEEVRRFAFIAAHDLVQPLHTLGASLQLLLDRLPPSDDPQQAMLGDFVGQSVARMQSRVAGILDYARMIESRPAFDEIDLNRIAGECVRDLQAQIRQADAIVEVDALPIARGVEHLVARVIQNLLSNAIKYRHPDRRCRVSIESADAAAGMVAVRVVDNGIGIPKAQYDRIFELFARLHADDEIEGDGLGLALCDRIVQLHGGVIDVAASGTGGAVFTFSLQAGRQQD